MADGQTDGHTPHADIHRAYACVSRGKNDSPKAIPTAPVLLADYVTTGNGLKKNGVHCGL